MFCNFQSKKLNKRLLIGSALLCASLSTLNLTSCSDGYDLDDKQPSNLNSIYGYLEGRGKFTTFLHIIDDLGQKEVLSKTGSKTLFVADDAAFEEFFKSNKWGVTSYDQLTLAQKKLLLNSAMIDNPYPTSMLSTASGPIKGEVCRRASSQSLYDSVLVAYAKDYDELLPKNEFYDEIRKRDSVVLFTDASAASPMIHFNAKFISTNKFLSSDIDFLYNQPAGTRQSDDVYVNNSKIIEANEFCKNGFVHIVDKVIVPLDNMSQIIKSNSNMSVFHGLIDRYATADYIPYYTRAYNTNKGTDVDSVFILNYFSKRGTGSSSSTNVAFSKDYKKRTFGEAALKFDPGWNAYIPQVPSDRDPMMEDMGVILVPSDEAMQEWWNNSGKVIQDYYSPGETDVKVGIQKAPTSVINDLINVNMLNSFASSVPSRFPDVLNDANEPLGITESDVDKVYLGCNGAVYQTNKVFAPTSYSSVLFPAVIDTTNFKIIKNAIDNLQYDAYLNSMVSTYSFFIPTNNGMLTYIDPVSYGQDKSTLWEFHYNPKQTKQKAIYADVYECVLNADGTWSKQGKALYQVKDQDITDASSNYALRNRLEDLLDNIIVTEALQEGKMYYQTKGDNFVKITGNLNVEGEMYVSGSWQDERNQPLVVNRIFPMRNGMTYVVDGPLMGTSKSVCKRLSTIPEASDFLNMIKSCDLVFKVNTKDVWSAGDQVHGNLISIKKEGSKYTIVYLLNSFQYTLYVPSNAAMQMAYKMGLPTVEMLYNAELQDKADGAGTLHADSIRSVMIDFIKYHLQDNAIFMDKGFKSGQYESANTELIPALDDNGVVTNKYAPGRPHPIRVNVSASGITVNDTINVIKQKGLYNIYAREYWYKNSSGSSTTISNPHTANINNSSAVAVHLVDRPLLYNYTPGSKDPDKNQFLYKKRELAVVTIDGKNSSPRKKK